MNDHTRLLLIRSAVPLALLLLLLVGWSRLGDQADRAHAAMDELDRGRAVVAQLRGVGSIADRGVAEWSGVAGRVEAAAKVASLDDERLAKIERVEGDNGGDAVRVDFRGVTVRALAVFLNAWSVPGSGRGALVVNLNPFGEADGELWSAQLRLLD